MHKKFYARRHRYACMVQETMYHISFFLNILTKPRLHNSFLSYPNKVPIMVRITNKEVVQPSGLVHPKIMNEQF